MPEASSDCPHCVNGVAFDAINGAAEPCDACAEGDKADADGVSLTRRATNAGLAP